MIPEIISITVFTLYIVAIVIIFGILKSVSDSYYHIKHKIFFTLALWGFAVPAMIAGGTVLMFLAGSAICFVGATPAFKMKHEGIVHYIGAVSGIILGMASMWLDFGLWWIVAIMAVGFVILRWKATNYTYWIELLAFYLILLGLIIS